jgi:TonB dependent receptor-like, beta-barrel/TonB-dependent Receptor Plug Domain
VKARPFEDRAAAVELARAKGFGTIDALILQTIPARPVVSADLFVVAAHRDRRFCLLNNPVASGPTKFVTSHLVSGVLLGVLLLFPIVSSGQTKQYVGRPVAEVLRELQTASSAVRIIFSSELVPATLRVKSEPKAGTVRDIVTEILAPHGLTLEPGPRGTFLVVAAPTKVPAVPAPRPSRIQSGAVEQPPAPVSVAADGVRIHEQVEVKERLAPGSETPGVYALEPSAISETAGAFENVFQALQVLPGVVATNDEDGKFAVRGAGPEHNLIVLDGVQIHNPQRYGEFTASFLNPATAASVTLDASGLDAGDGGRLSSVTTIETRDGSVDRRLAASGSLGLTSGDLLFEGRLPKTTSGSWWATARGTYYRAVADRFRDGALPSFYDGQGKVTLRPGRHTRMTFFGLAGRESMTEYDKAEDGSTIVAAEFKGDNRLGALNLWWTPNSRFATTTTLSGYAHDERAYDRFVLFGIQPFERRLSVHDFAVRQRGVFAISSRHVVDAGLELHRIRTSWHMASMTEREFWRGLGPSTLGESIEYGSGPIDTHVTRTQAGFWIQDRLPLGGRLTLEPGVRLDWNSFTGEAAWQPRVRLTGRFLRTTVWAGLAVQAQTPSHESLQGFDYFHLTAADGSRLRNERLRQVVLGAERALDGGFTIRIEGYRRRFDRLLVQRLETDIERSARLAAYQIPPDLPSDSVVLEYRPTIYPESTGLGTATGVEVLLQRQGKRASGWIAYTLSKATREMYGFSVPFDFDRRHALSAVGNLQVLRSVRLSATWQRASGLPVTPMREEVSFGRTPLPGGNLDPVFRPWRRPDGSFYTFPNPFMRPLALRNADHLSGYSRTDARLTYSTLGHWEFYGEIINVFNDRNYLQTFRIPTGTPGQEETASNNVYSELDRIPTFGIRVKF